LGKIIPGDKPFGLSYFYAHNNLNATGGYRDRLQMEDHSMNQPRPVRKAGAMALESNIAGNCADNPAIVASRENGMFQ
jgi:hypothetical protein